MEKVCSYRLLHPTALIPSGEFRRDWINENRRRRYTVIVQRDLLGDWTVVRQWSAIDSPRGGQLIQVLEEGSAAIPSLVASIARRRSARGYVIQSR